MFSLDDIVLFVGVVDAGGFSAAARALHLSTPLISKRMSALERDLDTRLLNRTTRRLSLTEAGSVFYRHGVQVLATAHEAEAAVNFLNAAPRGLLRVTAPVTFGTQQLARALPGFLERYPEVQVEMDVSDRPVDLAEEGYDLAIRITRNPPQLLSARLLTHTRRLVCAAPAYWNRHGRPQRPADLEAHDCILYTGNPGFNEWVFNSPAGEDRVFVQGRLKINSTSAMLEAAIGGLGVTMLTSLGVERALQAGELEAVLTDYVTPDADIYALYLPNRYLSNKARAFIDYLLERYAAPT